ncbi:unnamed protein product [Didymodactylos carnosus]|uniref:Uncharacterized protein n=1 Tax=Didymodactylos carnosus TaxID=1234261 RepID=A0A8S2D2J3_9BILA|nr:unnamed protein product [Didymodactylos carnosus]CAF3570488.1 unnamed protein product [Didymodactylos carnosus]
MGNFLSQKTRANAELIELFDIFDGNSSLSSSKSTNGELIFEDYVVIWLDTNITGDWQETEMEIRPIINYFKTFDNVDECIKYIKSLIDEKVFLIVTGTFIKQICLRIAEFPNLLSIYLWCSNKTKYEKWLKNHPHITGIYLTMDSLLPQLTNDVKVCLNDLIPLSTIHSTITDLSKHNVLFPSFQFLIDVLLKMPPKELNRKSLLRQLRHYYKDNEIELDIITDFENDYSSQNAITWYLRHTFLYRLLNKACRTQGGLHNGWMSNTQCNPLLINYNMSSLVLES